MARPRHLRPALEGQRESIAGRGLCQRSTLIVRVNFGRNMENELEKETRNWPFGFLHLLRSGIMMAVTGRWWGGGRDGIKSADS